MEWVIATFHPRLWQDTLKKDSTTTASSPPIQCHPLGDPTSYSSGRERAKVCQSSSPEAASRPRLRAWLQ